MAQIPALAKVTVDPARAVAATIGPAGGTIETTDAAGSTYRLVIPEGALLADTTIAAVPVTAIAGLPEQLRILGGVHLVPEGLRFSKLAELTIEAADPPAGVIVPFAYDGDLTEPQRYPAQLDGSRTTFGIVHFSGYALLQATSAATTAAEIDLVIPWAPPSGPADVALTRIAAALEGTTILSRDETINAAMRSWLQHLETQVDGFRAIATWDVDGDFGGAALDLVGSFDLWAYLRKLFILTGVQLDPALDAALKPLVTAAAVHGIAASNTNCAVTSTDDLIDFRLPWQLVWQAAANNHGVTGNDPSLRRETIIENLCAEVVFDPNGGTDFPSGIQPGQTGTLSVRVGLSVDGGAPRFDARIDITVTSHGAAPDAVVEQRTAADGRFARQFLWDPEASQLRLDVAACIPGMPACQEAFVLRGTGSTPPPPTVGPVGQCPQYAVTVNGQEHVGAGPDGLTVTTDTASASALATKSLILNAFGGGSASGTIKVRYTVDASLASGGPSAITVVFYGRVQDAGGGHARVTLKVGDVTRTFTSPGTDSNGTDVGPGTLEVPITVTHGQVVMVEVLGAVRSDGGRTTLTGGIHFLNRPEQVVFGHPGCG